MYKKALFFLLLFTLPAMLLSQDWLQPEEREWIKENRDKSFTIGFDPNSGMELFTLNGKEYGVILDLSAHLSQATGLQFIPNKEMSWGEAITSLRTGEIEILFGANETPERRKTMSFTPPLYKVPYSLLAKKNRGIHVIGDLEDKKIGFIAEDVIISLFAEEYSTVPYEPRIFNSQKEALASLNEGTISGFITSGGTVVYDYLKEYPSIKQIKVLSRFTSDMTLSVRKENSVLLGILKKYMKRYSLELEDFIEKSRYRFNYRVMDLTPAEVKWLEQDGTAVFGVTKDYLPFEYMENGQLKGICGALTREISHLTGIRFVPVYSGFDDLYNQALQGDIHVLNIARTQERLTHFRFTRPFSKERDIIYGKSDSPAVEDIYDFRDATVAVIEGYWHEELLEKDSPEAQILITRNLKESMQAIMRGKADYMIENPSVVKYFVDEWDFHEIVEKGLTSHNSYLYFGIIQSKPELARIMDQAMTLIDLESAIHKGYNEVPHSNNRKRIMVQLFFIILLLFLLFLLGLFTYRQTKALVESRIAHERMKEKEELMYRDPMTGIYNRHYLYHKVEPFIDKWVYPQSVVICDLNNLKTTNDKFGHAYGDKLLSHFAEVLSECFQNDDILIRQGGDEFMILIIGKGTVYTTEKAQCMERCLKKKKIPIAGQEGEQISPSTAWGMASRNRASEVNFEDMLVLADNRMYQHKRKNKKPVNP